MVYLDVYLVTCLLWFIWHYRTYRAQQAERYSTPVIIGGMSLLWPIVVSLTIMYLFITWVWREHVSKD